MANNNYNFTGRLAIGKKTEKFDPFVDKISDKGWETTRLKFNVIAGDNRHFVQIEGGHWADGHGEIYSYTKGGIDDNGKKIKGESIKVPFKDRFNQDIIDNIAEFKKSVFDLEKPNLRYKIKKSLEKLENEDITADDISELGVDSYIDEKATKEELEKLVKEFKKTEDKKKKVEIKTKVDFLKTHSRIKELNAEMEIKEKQEILKIMLEVSNSKRKEFLSDLDFAKYTHDLITKGDISNMIFNVKCEKVSKEYNGKVYENMEVRRIYLTDPKAEQVSEGTFTIYFNQNSLDENSYESDKKYFVNAYTREYDNDRKEEIPCPMQLVIDCTKDEDNEKNKKLNKLLKNQFVIEDESWKEIGVKVKVLNGSQKVEITEDMLTDIQKELLELEAITMDEIRRDLGGDPYGDKIKENVIVNVSRGYSKGRKDTVYIDDDFIIKEVEVESKDKEEDIFTDELELDIE